jgi:Rrf2 family iron-sulfur cluster assembly transcriptional regulator
MKITALDEYGLRILLRIARSDNEEGISISQLSDLEGLSSSYVAKLARTLRKGGLIASNRGQKGGYVLAKPASEITINEALHALGGTLFDKEFCGSHAGDMAFCTNSVDCSIRSLWRMVQESVDQLLDKVTVEDLMATERESTHVLKQFLEEEEDVEAN